MFPLRNAVEMIVAISYFNRRRKIRFDGTLDTSNSYGALRYIPTVHYDTLLWHITTWDYDIYTSHLTHSLSMSTLGTRRTFRYGTIISYVT
jgi:hypothetical protein